MEQVRLGIIGLGTMGKNYVRAYSEHPLASVVAVCDRSEGALQEISGRYGIPGYGDHLAMLNRNDLDAVVVATPDAHHFDVAKDALDSGRHVLIEKPLTMKAEESDALIRTAKRVNKKIQVTFNHRWLACYQETKRSIAAGAIGVPLIGYARKNDTIRASTKHIKWASETTSAWFLSSHDIDLVRWWLASEPVEARAWGRQEVLVKLGIPTYDVIQAQVKFASGALVTFESGWVYPNTFPSTVDSFMEIIGSSGHVHLDRKRESIEISTAEKFSYPKVFLISDVFGRMRGAFPSCLEDFLYAVLNDTQPHVTGFDGRQVTATLEAIHKALKTGDTVRISEPPADIVEA